MDGEAIFVAVGGGAEAGGVGAFGELSRVDTEGAEGTGFGGGTGFSEARERGVVSLDGAGFEEAEGVGVADVCWPAEETDVVACCDGLVEATFSSGLSGCFIGGV